MAPGTHTFISWWTANVLPLSRRDRFLVFLGGLLPDLDGLGILFSWDAYFTYHHVLCHNVFACLAWVILAGIVAKARTICMTQAFLNWHLHMACDYFGSRGPQPDPPWVLPYFYPLIGGWKDSTFTGPSWYWNEWQWELNAWPNIAVTWLALLGWFYIALRLNRTFMEFVWPRLDPDFCRLLRKWLGVKREIGWSSFEAKMIRRGYLSVTVAFFFACILAAIRS